MLGGKKIKIIKAATQKTKQVWGFFVTRKAQLRSSKYKKVCEI